MSVSGFTALMAEPSVSCDMKQEMAEWSSPVWEKLSQRERASPRKSSTSYVRRGEIRKMSSVRLVSVAETRVDCAVKAEMCAWVWETVAESARGAVLFEADEAEEGRVALR